MRMRPGLNFDFTILELNAMLQELFKHDPEHPKVFRLPQGVVPLCNNSSLSRIRAMMPLCDSHGIDPTWQEPAYDVVQAFFDGLVEVPIRPDEQEGLIRATTDEEVQRIATRLEEAAAAAAAGEFGFTVEEVEAAEAASLAEREGLAGEEEPHAAAATGAGSSRTAASAPAASHAAAATGAGSSQTTVTAPAKRPREPTPPPPRAGGGPGFDFSALSSDEEEEE